MPAQDAVEAIEAAGSGPETGRQLAFLDTVQPIKLPAVEYGGGGPENSTSCCRRTCSQPAKPRLRHKRWVEVGARQRMPSGALTQ
jgi:hypothetical protein